MGGEGRAEGAGGGRGGGEGIAAHWTRTRAIPTVNCSPAVNPIHDRLHMAVMQLVPRGSHRGQPHLNTNGRIVRAPNRFNGVLL